MNERHYVMSRDARDPPANFGAYPIYERKS